ncbi:mannose-6-phosphate isomerase, class I [Candidatus Haliotispira prima]|uniref:mannose-6-phosphate isomerase n=1 Tax=Candidatus Haliotispira prima TaxID=3034016 RepID=A0ABY8MG85_9SPIO|nr:mannose-6-phosphate isomerase, class I [Candidatus Haliotispira prima]
MRVAKLYNQIQSFAWGSGSFLPELLGYENPEHTPQAELWMGVHPIGESSVETVSEGKSGRIPLSRYLRNNNDQQDGSIDSDMPTESQSLPFLFKVLSSERPLSIQAHPNKAQAEEGFRRENQAGIPLNAPHRNYKDPNHKPEITLALTPFWALCGFRSLTEIKQNFSHFAGSLPDFNDHEEFFSGLMQMEAGQKAALIEQTLQRCKSGARDYGLDVSKWILRLAEFYPGDLGALAPLYLHLFCLEPGQAIYLPAGILHAYLEGSAMELMSNSDNVLRGGLTPKHQDIPELMKTLVFEEFPPRIIEAIKMDLHRSYYPTNATEFRLERWSLSTEDSGLYFPQKHTVMLAFVYQGRAEINGMTLEQGQSCIIPASCGEISAKICKGPQETPSATLYVAVAKDI